MLANIYNNKPPGWLFSALKAEMGQIRSHHLWYLARMPMLAKWPNSSIKNKNPGWINPYLQKMPTVAKLVIRK